MLHQWEAYFKQPLRVVGPTSSTAVLKRRIFNQEVKKTFIQVEDKAYAIFLYHRARKHSGTRNGGEGTSSKTTFNAD